MVQINVRFDADDIALIDRLAAERGVSRSKIVKLAVVRVLAAERVRLG